MKSATFLTNRVFSVGSFLLVFSSILLPAGRAASISTEAATGCYGDAVAVSIVIDDSTVAEDFTFHMSYDPSVLQFDNTGALTTLTAGWAVAWTEMAPGDIAVSGLSQYTGAPPIPLGSSGSILDLDFTVICGTCTQGQTAAFTFTDIGEDFTGYTAVPGTFTYHCDPPLPVSIGAHNAFGSNGDTVTIPVSFIHTPEEVDAFGFQLSYCTDMLVFTGYSTGDLTTGWGTGNSEFAVIEPSPGMLLLGAYNLDAAIAQDSTGTVVNLTFLVDCTTCTGGETCNMVLGDLVDDIEFWGRSNGGFTYGEPGPIPATGPLGTGILILLLTVLMAVSALQRRQKEKKMTYRLLGIVILGLLLGSIAAARPPEAASPYGSEPLMQTDVKVDPGVMESRDTGIQGAGDRIVDTMCPAACGGKGIPWPLPPCPAPASVPANTLGPAGVGLLSGFGLTGDFDHLTGVLEFGDYGSCYAYPTGEFRFGSGTPYFLWYITEKMPGATSYRNHAQIEFMDALYNGTYGPSAMDTAAWLTAVWTSRPGDYINLRSSDVVNLIHSFREMGNPGQFDLGIEHARNAFNNCRDGYWWEVLGPACGIVSLALANVDYAPEDANMHFYGETDLFGCCQALLEAQTPFGGFAYGWDWTVSTADQWTLGGGFWHSGTADRLNTTLTKQFTITDVNVSFQYMHDLETNYDYGYFEYSSDGTTWTALSEFNGCIDTWTTENVTLPATGSYWLRFRYYSDTMVQGTGACGTAEPGLFIDNIVVNGVTDPCDAVNGWVIGSDDSVIQNYQDIQASAYALLALKAVDPWAFATEIAACEGYLMAQQMPNGGFSNLLIPGDENIQVDGEALWALTFEADPWNDGDVDGNKTLTVADAQAAFMIYMGLPPYNNPRFWTYNSADCNGDGDVTPEDARCIWSQVISPGSCSCADPIIVPPL